MKGILGITGTPATGKKTVAPIVAARLGAKCLSINELAKSYGLVGAGSEVDVEKLRSKLQRDIDLNAVVHGHLLPHVFDSRAVCRAVVLRCEPGVLKDRLLRRGYEQAKVVENVEAELIGVVSSDSYDAFGEAKVWELDTTHTTPEEVAAAVVKIAGPSPKPVPRIDWTLDYDSGAKLRLLLSTAE